MHCPKRIRWLVVAVVIALVGMSLLHQATAEQQRPARSLDDELLENLGSDPLDDVDHELFGPRSDDSSKPQKKADGEKAGDGESQPALDRPSLDRELGDAAVSEQDNPLLEIARDMRMVENRIREGEADQLTQGMQKQIISNLDALIKQARKSAKPCNKGDSQSQQTAARRPVGQPQQPKSGSPGQRPNDRPATTSTQRRQGTGDQQQVSAEELEAIMKQLWGELPQRQREQMLQSPPEQFLPKYRRLIEEYFRRLSEEK